MTTKKIAAARPDANGGKSFFICHKSDLEILMRSDERMAALVTARGHIKRQVFPDPFKGLVNAVLGQQISTKAHQTIWARYEAQYGELTPAQIAMRDPEELKQIGTSSRKANYIIGIAKEYEARGMAKLDPDELGNNLLTRELESLPGVGPWTAEMTLIFSYQRRDVISFHDLGIKRGLMLLYGLKKISFDKFISITRKYQPAATLASLYLWELAGGRVPGWQ